MLFSLYPSLFWELKDKKKTENYFYSFDRKPQSLNIERGLFNLFVQESHPLGRSKFVRVLRVIVSYSQPIGFVGLDSEHAQRDGKSVNRGLSVLDLPRARDSSC